MLSVGAEECVRISSMQQMGRRKCLSLWSLWFLSRSMIACASSEQHQQQQEACSLYSMQDADDYWSAVLLV